MLELGYFHNGQTDLPLKRISESMVLPSGSLKDMHASMQRVLLNQVRQGVLAEKLGFDILYFTEHHFQPEGTEFSPNPMLLETAIAAQTNSIKLGQYANIITWWHPIRIAEHAAMLDVISGGRLEFGIGRGYQPRESEVFGRNYGATIQDQERNRAAFEEAWEIILKAWTQPSFSHHGENFSIPPSYTKWHHEQTIALYSQDGYDPPVDRVLSVGKANPNSSLGPVIGGGTILREISVFPQPVQKPHPQVAMPLTSERSIRWAAAHGMNGGFQVEPAWLLRKNVEIYFNEAAKKEWPDRLNRGEFKWGWDGARRRGIGVFKVCHITRDAKDRHSRERLNMSLQLGQKYYGGFGFVPLLAKPGETIRDDYIPDVDFLEDHEFLFIGTGEEVAAKILKLRSELGFDDFKFGAVLEGAGYSGEETEEQMHLFAQEVIPILRRECGEGPAKDKVAPAGPSMSPRSTGGH